MYIEDSAQAKLDLKLVSGASLVVQWLRIRLGFEPWSGKIPHAAEQLSP